MSMTLSVGKTIYVKNHGYFCLYWEDINIFLSFFFLINQTLFYNI